ncbi:MAG: polysaccharide pyruvyl transferase family protein [Candidatus Gracilibacteria bacterium]|nr:polysaccharide pyruvyl transferase family protein [Candidatus Gracilibacteria bacterium]
MNISIFASIGCQNLGDELILKNEIKIFEKIYNDKKINFRVFSYDVKNPFFSKKNVTYLEYFPIGIRQKKNFFRNIKNFFVFIRSVIWSNLIVVGGGGIIYDNEIQANNTPLDQLIFRNKIFKLFRKKVIYYAVGINIKNKENLSKLPLIFSSAHKVYVRDASSFKTLEKLKITAEIIDDPVFFDNINNPKIIDNKPVLDIKEKDVFLKEIESTKFSLKDLENIDYSNKKIGITFRAGQIGKSGNEKIEIFMIRELIELLLSKNAQVFFLPHSINKTDEKSNDLDYYKNIISGAKLENKVYLIQDLNEVYSFYKDKKIDLCLSMRLHSMILSQVYEIPFVAFSYSKKTEELVKKIRQDSITQKIGD